MSRYEDETCVYVPFAPNEREESVTEQIDEERLNGYRHVWSRCLSRIQDTTYRLTDKVVFEAVENILGAYEGLLHGLPYAELPALVVGGGSALVSSICSQLQGLYRDNDHEEEYIGAYVTHLDPAECGNVMNTMKALISGFLSSEDGSNRRRTATSLANYDITLLRAWYKACGDGRPLVVILHRFEQFSSEVLQDFVHICSCQIPELPFVFVLSTMSPVPQTYLQSTFPRRTLALFRVTHLAALDGSRMLEEIISHLFFEPTTNVSIMLGPTTVDFLVEYCGQVHASIDGIVTIIQLLHMKHFEHQLAVLLSASLDVQLLETPAGYPILNELLSRMHGNQAARPDGESWSNVSVQSLLSSFHTTRTSFESKVRGVREVYGLVRAAGEWMRERGLKAFDDQGKKVDEDERGLRLMRKVLDCTVARDVKHMGMMIGKFDVAQLGDFTPLLHEHISAAVSSLESATIDGSQEHTNTSSIESLTRALDTVEGIVVELEDLSTSSNQKRSPRVVELGESVRHIFTEFIAERLVPLDTPTVSPLWDLFYTGSTPFPSELLNPAPRASVIGGLLYPHLYAQAASGQTSSKVENGSSSVPGTPSRRSLSRSPSKSPSKRKRRSSVERNDESGTTQEGRLRMHELPDTSILFRRYLDAGRMLNVHDWFASFAQAVERQRPDGVPEDDETWTTEVHARFMRALFELDFMGFIKHTRRKAEHVMRTVWEVAE